MRKVPLSHTFVLGGFCAIFAFCDEEHLGVGCDGRHTVAVCACTFSDKR